MKTFSKYISEGIFDTIKGKVKDILFGLSFKYLGDGSDFITFNKDYIDKLDKNLRLELVIKYKKIQSFPIDKVTNDIIALYVSYYSYISGNDFIEVKNVKDLEKEIIKLDSKYKDEDMIQMLKGLNPKANNINKEYTWKSIKVLLLQMVNDLKRIEK